MSSLKRMLAILDLFDEDRSYWTAESISARLGYTLPTAYRYVRELNEAGLLRRDAGGTYVLGTRIIELDYRIRVGDPLITAGEAVMRELAEQTECGVVLATLYGERIVTIHHEHGGDRFVPSFGRGRRMPLFRGMLSKTILSTLPRARLRKLFEGHLDEARDSVFARDWDTLLAETKAVRAAGFGLSHGELEAGRTGIAVALTNPERRIAAALGFIMSSARFDTSDPGRLVALLDSAARRIVEALPEGPNEEG